MSTIDRNGRIAGAVGLLALGAFALAALLVGFPTVGTTTRMGMMGGTGGPGIATFLFMLLPLVAVLALGYAGLRALSADDAAETEAGHASRDAVDEDPVERLKRRYAEGELSEDEFERALDRELAADADETGDRSGGDSAPRERSDPAYDR